MDQPSKIFTDWLNKLKADGKTDDEIGQLLAGVAKLSALDAYTAIMLSLTEVGIKEVEAIPDDEAAKKRMEELFLLRAGMSVADMIKAVQEKFAEGYLKAENNPIGK